MRPRFWAAVWLGALLLIGGCSPAVQQTARPSLPAPQVKITRAASASEPRATLVRPSPLPTRTQGTALSGSLMQMAEAAYGPRLIAHIQIPSLRINAPVVPVGWRAKDLAGDEVDWESPDASVGWAVSSALPDEAGNVILYGHNNLHSNVFMHLADVKHGESVVLDTGEKSYTYQVESVEIIPVEDARADAAAYQRYFQPSPQAQLTIVSCWPPTSNTHRVIVIAKP